MGILKSNTPTRPFLLTCKFLKNTNHSTITRFINDGLKFLWSLGGNDEKVLLMLSDAALYITKTGDTLVVFYPNLIHVTCVLCSSDDEQGCREDQRNVSKCEQTDL